MFAGLISQVHVLKVGVPDGFVHLVPQEKVPGFDCPPSCGLQHRMWGLWQHCVPVSPTHFVVVFLSFA